MKGFQALHDVEALEERLQMVKWDLTPLHPTTSAAPTERDDIVTQTAGLLGKRFPRGVVYVRRLRAAWRKRLAA